MQVGLLKDARIIWCIVLSITTAATTYGYYTYIRPLINQELGFSPQTLSLILLMLGILDLIGTLIGGRLAENNPIKKLRFIYLFMAIMLLLFSLAMQHKATGILLLASMMLLFPAAQSPIKIYFLNVASKDYPASISLASSLNAVFYNVGIAIASLSAGFTLEHFGLRHLGFNSLVYCLIALSSIFILIYLNKRHAPKI
ncbi:Major Facilitator Superfamily protein [Ligilactobacillus sp. WC1T17]|uniref:Major Facilitator Superfamily protein n=1 Tax=Ligilactobacillus ruminis TaxID=1623 RepID=A0ABY1ADK0_9LACO|nr:Major Facilitator Superfamily protein [Ligilactobacillus ruminis]